MAHRRSFKARAQPSPCSQVKLKLDASENSLRQVAPMRRHIRDICDLLMELQDLDVQSDAASLQSIFLEMKDAAAGAADKAERGQQHLIAVSQQIRDIQLTYITRRDRCMSDQKACEDEAENKKIETQSLKCRAVGQGAGSFACGAAGTGATGVGATVAYLGAQTVASLPYLGPLLTTTGPTGLFTAAVVSFNPVGVGVLVGCSVKNAAHQKEADKATCFLFDSLRFPNQEALLGSMLVTRLCQANANCSKHSAPGRVESRMFGAFWV